MEHGQCLNAMAVGLDTGPDRERVHRPADARVTPEHDVPEEGVPVGHMVEHQARILQAGGQEAVKILFRDDGPGVDLREAPGVVGVGPEERDC
jgi:hypothetical protein